MLPTNAIARHVAVTTADDTTRHAPRVPLRSALADATPLERELATAGHEILRSMAREHLALCPAIKRFSDEVDSLSAHEADVIDKLVAYASARLGLPSAPPPTRATSWGWSEKHDMQAELFLQRAAPQVTEAALCRALAQRLLTGIGDQGPDARPASADLMRTRAVALKHRLGFPVQESCILAPDAATGALGVHSDASLLGRSLWRALRHERSATGDAPDSAPDSTSDGVSDGDLVASDLPGSPSRQLRIEDNEWVTVSGYGGKEAPVRLDDLALIDSASGPRSLLPGHARERTALTVVASSSVGELLDFPASWVCSPAVASALLERLDDGAMSRWLARQTLTQRADIGRWIADACVASWRHGLVAGGVDALGKDVVLKSLSSRAEQWHDERCLTRACHLGNAERVGAMLDGLLGSIGQGLTADEVMSVLWREENGPSLAVGRGHRCATAFVDALAPALLDGRLSAEQATLLLGGGRPKEAGYGLQTVFFHGFGSEAKRFLDRLRACRGPGGLSADQLVSIITGTVAHHQGPGATFTAQTVKNGSPAHISAWYAEILSLWRDEQIDAGHARSLMLGRNIRGGSAWQEALHAASRRADHDPGAVLALVEAWSIAIRAGLQPPGGLRDGLLSRSPFTERGMLGRAAACGDSGWLSGLFTRLGDLRREGVVREADLCEILDATLDTHGLMRAVAMEYPNAEPTWHSSVLRFTAQYQLTTFERMLNECLSADVIDEASAATLLLARRDDQPSKSVVAAALAGRDSDTHTRLLRDALYRGAISPEQRTEAVLLAARYAAVIDAPPPPQRADRMRGDR